MKNNFPNGVWPVMLTPYDEKGGLDYVALRELVDWYLKNGVAGLFAVCQSSEMFFLSLEERVALAKAVVDFTAGRVPVIASGHISDSAEEQARELSEMAQTGIDALILISNRMQDGGDDDLWIKHCEKIILSLPESLPLGLYECPYPGKRLLTNKILQWAVETKRFYFIKDTCCDLDLIRKRLKIVEGSLIKLYNANTTTLLDSLRFGAAGYSGVMANFHPRLYVELCQLKSDSTRLKKISDFATIASLIERQCYPVNAKYHLAEIENLNIEIFSRAMDKSLLTETFKKEVVTMDRLAKEL